MSRISASIDDHSPVEVVQNFTASPDVSLICSLAKHFRSDVFVYYVQHAQSVHLPAAALNPFQEEPCPAAPLILLV